MKKQPVYIFGFLKGEGVKGGGGGERKKGGGGGVQASDCLTLAVFTWSVYQWRVAPQ